MNLNKDFWQNVYGQIHALWQTFGIAVLTELCYYIVQHDSADWTWKGLIVSAATGCLTYILTKRDHIKTEKAVEKAAVTGEVPNLPKGENS